MAEDYTKEELKEINRELKEVRSLAKQFSSDMKIVEALTNATSLNLGKIVDLGKENTAQAEKEKKFREDVNDLTKEILQNAENIGTEEFKSLDVATKLTKARKMGDKDLVKQLSHLKSINKLQQQQNKQIMSAANLIKKPFEALDSAIRQIPVIGELLGDVADFGGIGESLSQGFIEGIVSGMAENADIGKRFGSFIFGQSGERKRLMEVMAAHNDTAESYKQAQFRLSQLNQGIVGNLLQSTVLTKALVGFGVLAAAAFAKLVASSVKFANETGLAYSDMLRMGPALLFNADAVRSFSEELGTVNNLTGMQALRLQLIEKRFGLSAESAAKLFAVQRGITGASMDTFLAQQRTTAKLARQAGVAPAAVFDDMAQNAEFIAKFSDGTAESIRDAAIEARKMGINLGKVESIAEGLLDFETSIEKQMTAQVLLGRSINLDRARTLFFNNKNKEGLQEVANQLGGIGALNQMDFIQRKAVADLLNVQVGDLSKMLGAQQNVNQAAEQQKSSMLGSIAAGAALGAILVGTVMALKAVLSRGLSLKSDTKNAIAGYAAGMTAGAVAGGAGMALYKSLTADSDMPELASGGVIVGEKGPEVVAPLPPQGVNVDNSGIESRMDKLIEQNQFLMNKLIRTTGELSLNNA